MKRSFWITLAVTVAVCAAALLMQSMKNRSLAEKLANQNAVTGTPEIRSQGVAPTAVSSDERIEVARSGIEELIEDPPAGSMVDVLRMVEGLSLDELIAVTRDLPSSYIRRFLVILAAEQDALRVSRDEKLMGDFYMPEIGRMIAKQDPVRALESLPKPKPVEYSASCMRCHAEGATKSGGCIRSIPIGDGWGIATTLFIEDAEAGLRALHQMDKFDNSKLRKMNEPLPKLALAGSIRLNNDQLSAITAAMNDPEYSSIRTDMINLALTDAIHEEGVAAMAQRMKTLPLTEEELDRYMDSVIQDGSGRGSGNQLDILFTEPAETIQWVAEARSETDQRKMIPDMVLNWAKRDANAAFGWISKQAPSPLRDATIARLVTKGPNLEQGSAESWAGQIQDQALRESTLQELLKAGR